MDLFFLNSQVILLLDPLIMDFLLWDLTRNTSRIRSRLNNLVFKQGNRGNSDLKLFQIVEYKYIPNEYIL